MKNPTRTSITAIAIAGCLAFTLSLWAQDTDADEPQARTAQWQHLALPHEATKAWNDRELAAQINKLGREGWELVSVLNFDKAGTTDKTIYYFKKPL